MNTLHNLVVRDDSKSSMTPTPMNLLIVFVVLFAAVAIMVGSLLLLRQCRRRRNLTERDTLPMYTEKSSMCSSRLTVSHIHEKQSLIESTTECNIPEIRITFPEEVDEAGKRTSGRVVIVKVGEHSVGLEPVSEDLPPYEKVGGARFQSLDLERMGGLKEGGKTWS